MNSKSLSLDTLNIVLIPFGVVSVYSSRVCSTYLCVCVKTGILFPQFIYVHCYGSLCLSYLGVCLCVCVHTITCRCGHLSCRSVMSGNLIQQY